MRAHLPLCVALAALIAVPDAILAAPPSRGAGHPQVERGEPYRVSRGERLPPVYRARSYVVDNWRVHRLYAPPRGHYWVGIGADYLLVAIATGIVVDVLTAPRVVVVPAPGVAASQPPAAAIFYYFCDSANAYYPYVRQCPEGWRALPTTPPGPLR